MSKEAKQQANPMAEALALVETNFSKKRGGSSRTTYLDRFVKALLDEDGQPVAGKTRNLLTAEIAMSIEVENRNTAIAAGEAEVEFSLENDEDKASFLETAKKVKPMVAAAISNSQNSTALPYNEKYKDTWKVVQDKAEGTVRLEAIEG